MDVEAGSFGVRVPVVNELTLFHNQGYGTNRRCCSPHKLGFNVDRTARGSFNTSSVPLFMLDLAWAGSKAFPIWFDEYEMQIQAGRQSRDNIK